MLMGKLTTALHTWLEVQRDRTERLGRLSAALKRFQQRAMVACMLHWQHHTSDGIKTRQQLLLGASRFLIAKLTAAWSSWVDFASPAAAASERQRPAALFDGGSAAFMTCTGPPASCDASRPVFSPTPWWQAVVFLAEPRQLDVGPGGELELEVELELDLSRGGALRGGLRGGD